MSRVTLGGFALLDGFLSMPLSGSWHLSATIEFPDGAALPSGRIILTVAGDGEPDVDLHGIVAYATDPDTGSAYVRVVGGQTGAFSAEPPLAAEVEGRHYDGDPVPATAAELLTDLATEVGETVLPSALSSLEGLSVVSWHRPASSAITALATLLRGPSVSPWGLSARFLNTAELWAGVETWPEISDPRSVDPTDDGRALHVAPNGLSILPGVTVLGRRARRVQYLFTADAMRARLWYAEP